jgi:hypothetical protein
MAFEFNNHDRLKGRHAMLAPSQPYWLDYDNEQLEQKYRSTYAQSIGTAAHELAETLIRERIKVKKTDKSMLLVHILRSGIPRTAIDIDRLFNNFMEYVNDAIGFGLVPEQILYYSDSCFGTADTILYKNNFLRIHDYKSGTTPAKMGQLLVYAALFCLEYKVKPGDLTGVELRIYQNDEILYHNPTAEEILPIMDKIVHLNKLLEKLENKEV